MRELLDHTIFPDDPLHVVVADEPGPGGDNHRYVVQSRPQHDADALAALSVLADIRFQEGPIPENGINGVTLEALLAICADRLRGCQSGPYACVPNALALRAIENALATLHIRTRERVERAVEGKLEA